MTRQFILNILATALLGVFIIHPNLLAQDDLDDAAILECDGGTVSQGDAEDSVRDKCGSPQKVTQEDAASPIIWFYNFGPTKFVYYVSFTNRMVERIQMGGYGD